MGRCWKGYYWITFQIAKKAVRIICRSNYIEHTAPLFKSLELLTVHKVYDLKCTLFIYKCLNCHYFPELKMRIQRQSEYHNYNTRGRNLFRNVDIVRLRICQRSFLNHGLNTWNSLIPEIKKKVSLFIEWKLPWKHILLLIFFC